MLTTGLDPVTVLRVGSSCAKHGTRVGRNLDRAVGRRGSNPEAKGRLDEVDESETGLAKLWSGPRKGAGRFLGRGAPRKLVESDRARHCDVERLASTGLRDRGALVAPIEQLGR